MKSVKATLNLKDNKQKTKKTQNDKKLVFQKNLVENADLVKRVLKRIITTHDWRMKYSFGGQYYWQYFGGQ